MKNSSRWVGLCLATAVLAGVALVVNHNIAARQDNNGTGRGGPPTASRDGTESSARPDRSPVLTNVSVVTRLPDIYQASVTGYGEATSRFTLNLSSRATGLVESISDGFESGHRVTKGDLLVQIEDSSYRAELRNAEYELKTARLALLEAEREAMQARAEWSAAGLDGDPDSPLVLQQPQVAAASAAVTNSEAAVNSATTDLAQTRVRAPFDALVVDREVAPGSYIQAGTQIGTLYSTDRVEIPLAVTVSDWQLLPDDEVLNEGNWPATIRSVQSGDQWLGRVVRIHGHLDGDTRQRTLVIAVDDPLDQSPPLLPGTFVSVSIDGRLVDGLWQLPGSAISQRGEIWYIDDDGALARFAATPAFSDDENIYIVPPAELTDAPRRVLVQPLSSYVMGMLATATDTETGEARPEVAHNE